MAAGCELFHTKNRDQWRQAERHIMKFRAGGFSRSSELPLSEYAKLVRDGPGKS
jgi:hypothetical protein